MLQNYKRLLRISSPLYPILIIIILILLEDKVSAASPFAIQEIKDPETDWINMNTREHDMEHGERFTDILAVNYYTDGEFLNSTVWLYFPFEDKPKFSQVNYGILIDADFDKRTGLEGIDYQLETRWDNNSEAWTEKLMAWSPNGEKRTIDFKNNHTGFFEPGEYYVNLSLNLDRVGSPVKYKVIFYGEVVKDGASFTDFTRWVALPPPQLGITTSPSSVELRKGEEKTIEVRLNSSQGYEPTVNIYAKSTVNKINFEFPQNDTLFIPAYGVATTPLTIRASNDASVGPYTLLIFANSSFPPEQLIEIESTNNKSCIFYCAIPTENILTQSSVFVTVQEPLGWIDQVSDFWNKMGNPISFIYGILAGISPWIYSKLRKQTKNDDEKNKKQPDSAV